MTQLPERPPADWTLAVTGGETDYAADAEFKKEVKEYNRRYLFWDELKYRIPNPERRLRAWAS